MGLRSGIKVRVMTGLGLRPRLGVLFRIAQFYAFHIVRTRKGNDVKIRVRAKG